MENTLKKYQDQIEKMSSEDIQKNQVNLLTSINRDIAMIRARILLELGKTGNKLAEEELLSFIGTNSGLLRNFTNREAKILSDQIAEGGKFLRNSMDGVGEKLNTGLKNSVKGILGIVNPEQKNEIPIKKENKKQTNIENNNSKITYEHNINLKSSAPIMDPLMKEWWSKINLDKRDFIVQP